MQIKTAVEIIDSIGKEGLAKGVRPAMMELYTLSILANACADLAAKVAQSDPRYMQAVYPHFLDPKAAGARSPLFSSESKTDGNDSDKTAGS